MGLDNHSLFKAGLKKEKEKQVMCRAAVNYPKGFLSLDEISNLENLVYISSSSGFIQSKKRYRKVRAGDWSLRSQYPVKSGIK